MPLLQTSSSRSPVNHCTTIICSLWTRGQILEPTNLGATSSSATLAVAPWTDLMSEQEAPKIPHRVAVGVKADIGA